MFKSSNSARRRGGTAGFTLLEVIVAFTILAVALVGLLQAFSSGLRGLGAAESHALAVLNARSILERVGVTIPLAPGESEGELEDGFRWRSVIQPYDTGATTEELLSVVPYVVEVTVTRGPGTRVVLTTLRLGDQP